MEFTMKMHKENKVFNDSSDVLELFFCMTKQEHQSIKFSPCAIECQIIPLTWNKALEMTNVIRLMYQDKCNKTHNITDETVLNFNAINILHSGFYSRHGILNPFNILSCFTKSMRYSIDKLNLPPPQEYSILLPSYDVEYASKFYSLRKIDSIFNYFDLEDSGTLLQPELFPGFEDISKENCPKKTRESNLILASSSASKLIFPVKARNSDSICTDDSDETWFASKRTNDCEKKQMSYRLAPNIKFHSVKSRDYFVDLMKNYKSSHFPMKRRKKAFQEQRISTKSLCNVFTKNRQFSENALHQNYRYSKRYYFAKDLNHTITDDCIPTNLAENCDEFCSSSQINSRVPQISGKHVKSKIAEIRQKIKNLSRNVNYELIRREQHHTSFIEQCKQISDLTISSYDYNKIYHTKSLRNKVKTSHRDDVCDFNLSDLQENHCYKVPKQNEAVTPHSQVFNQSEASNSRDHVENESAPLNFHKQVLKQREVFILKKTSYFKNCFSNFRHQIFVVLSTISVPFVAFLFR